MVNRDGKGPQGKGSKTGWGLGNCEETDSQERNTDLFRSNRPRVRRGRGQGMRRGIIF